MKIGSCFTGKLGYVSPNPSLSGLSALLSVDLLHGSDHKAQEQKIHLGVASVQCFLVTVICAMQRVSLEVWILPVDQFQCPWGSFPWCWCCSCPSARSPPSPASHPHLPSSTMLSARSSDIVVQENGETWSMTKCPPRVASIRKAGFLSSRESQSSIWTGGSCMKTPKDGFIIEPVFFTVANTITSNGHVIMHTRTNI